MATRIECSQCGRELKPHCAGDNLCGWWTCSNHVCDAHRFDLSRNILIHTDGRLERLAAPG